MGKQRPYSTTVDMVALGFWCSSLIAVHLWIRVHAAWFLPDQHLLQRQHLPTTFSLLVPGITVWGALEKLADNGLGGGGDRIDLKAKLQEPDQFDGSDLKKL
ncbi:hypothetical protein JB92DRAFT_2907248 [Gautieria morchelliformis]|nr:hypothetical protein JB92DRAFT_2907248 [Gautieria morchelliformis]